MKKLTMLDLFSGIGGFSIAGKWANFETIQFVEKDKFCQKVLAKNFPGIPIHDDIKTYNFTKHVDLITGGFPCQPFSIAGKKKGINDDRYLWPEMFRIIQQCNPSWIIAENVSGIVRNGLDRTLRDLEDDGYTWWAYVAPACAIGAPHKRERVWIIAHRNRERCNMWGDNIAERHLQNDAQRDVSQIYAEWAQLKPISWATHKSEDWFQFNTRVSRANDGIRRKLDEDRIKILGNSIIPQVAYPIMKVIKLIESKS